MSFTKKKCFKCLCNGLDKEVGLEYRIYPLDFPYVNLVFHKGCYKEIASTADEYIKENIKLVFKYAEKH